MSAEHTPLGIEPEGTARRFGVAALNDQSMDLYAEPDQLPDDSERRAICQRHMASGLSAEMMRDFWVQGCDFGTAAQEGVVRVEFSCNGLSRVLGKCRLTLTQYDAAGNKLNTGKFRQKID